MTTTVRAIYDSGQLMLSKPLPLPEKTPARVTIDAKVAKDAARSSCLKVSEKVLLQTWANQDDEVFNVLLN